MNTLDMEEVAVKTVKVRTDASHIKSLMNELKVLSYLDNGHENVLKILGASTGRLCYGTEAKVVKYILASFALIDE